MTFASCARFDGIYMIVHILHILLFICNICRLLGYIGAWCMLLYFTYIYIEENIQSYIVDIHGVFLSYITRFKLIYFRNL